MVTSLAVFDIPQLKGADLEVAGPILKSERESTGGIHAARTTGPATAPKSPPRPAQRRRMAPTVNHRSFELS